MVKLNHVLHDLYSPRRTSWRASSGRHRLMPKIDKFWKTRRLSSSAMWLWWLSTTGCWYICRGNIDHIWFTTSTHTLMQIVISEKLGTCLSLLKSELPTIRLHHIFFSEICTPVVYLFTCQFWQRVAQTYTRRVFVLLHGSVSACNMGECSEGPFY